MSEPYRGLLDEDLAELGEGLPVDALINAIGQAVYDEGTEHVKQVAEAAFEAVYHLSQRFAPGAPLVDCAEKACPHSVIMRALECLDPPAERAADLVGLPMLDEYDAAAVKAVLDYLDAVSNTIRQHLVEYDLG